MNIDLRDAVNRIFSTAWTSETPPHTAARTPESTDPGRTVPASPASEGVRAEAGTTINVAGPVSQAREEATGPAAPGEGQ